MWALEIRRIQRPVALISGNPLRHTSHMHERRVGRAYRCHVHDGRNLQCDYVVHLNVSSRHWFRIRRKPGDIFRWLVRQRCVFIREEDCSHTWRAHTVFAKPLFGLFEVVEFLVQCTRVTMHLCFGIFPLVPNAIPPAVSYNIVSFFCETLYALYARL